MDGFEAMVLLSLPWPIFKRVENSGSRKIELNRCDGGRSLTIRAINRALTSETRLFRIGSFRRCPARGQPRREREHSNAYQHQHGGYQHQT